MSDPVEVPSIDKFSEVTQTDPPRHLGTRHNSAGRFLNEPGNTVVCHLDAESSSTKSILAARQAMMNLPAANKFTFTNAESLHMTLFQGVIEFRRFPGFWPPDLDLGAPISAVTGFYQSRLAGFRGPGRFSVRPFAMTPNGMIVVGALENDRQNLALWRDQLADRFGYRHPDHDTYVFHITFAYQLEWLSGQEAAEYDLALTEIQNDLAENAPVIGLQAPAFCTFEDMNYFRPIQALDGFE